MVGRVRTVAHIDTSKPHPARMYDYYLGGKDHYEVDREAASRVMDIYPHIGVCARTNRTFMHRATRQLVAAGVRQFVDIGTGIPTEPNLHQVAQSAAPESRVVYADNDPIVLAHAQALLRSSPEGATAYIPADVREPERILESTELRQTLDMDRPLALSLNALLHFVPDEYEPYQIVRTLVDALPSGSFLVLTHCTPDFAPEVWERVLDVYRQGGIPVQVRGHAEVRRFFDGLDLLEPGVEVPHRWRPDATSTDPGVTDAQVSLYVGVARKP